MIVAAKQAEVLQLLESNGPMTVSQIASRLDKTPQGIWGLLQYLHKTHRKVRVKECLAVTTGGARAALWEAGEPVDGKPIRMKDQVVCWLKENSEGTCKEIAIGLGLDDRNCYLRVILKELHDKKQVHICDYQRQLITGGGMAAVYRLGEGRDKIKRPLSSKEKWEHFKERDGYKRLKLRKFQERGTMNMWTSIAVKQG